MRTQQANKMLKYVPLFCVMLTSVLCSEEARSHKYEDPFAALDRHLTHPLAYHYLWPWSQLIRAAAALDVEESLEEPLIVSDSKKFEVNLNVRKFQPEELRIKVKNRNIIIEGKHRETNEDKKFMTNHFVQRFVLPAGSKPEEVKAVLKENGVLTVAVPKHELPPPPPEIEVPIEVLAVENKKQDQKPEQVDKRVDKPEDTENKDTNKEKTTTANEDVTVSSSITSSSSKLEDLDSDLTTHAAGKIRKKDLKTTTKKDLKTNKTSKVNEVTKDADSNGLDYALIESDE